MTSTASRGARATSAATPVPSATFARFIRGVLGTLGALLVVLGPGVVPAMAQPAVVPAASADDGVSAQVVSLGPAVVTPDDTLKITVRVQNTGDETVEDPAAFLGVDRGSLGTRSSLQNWVDAGVTGRTGYRVADKDLDALAPDASADVTFEVEAAQLGITAGSDWGPRGLAAVVTDAGSRVAVARTFVVQPPSGDVTPLDLSVLAAVTGPAVGPDATTGSEALSAAAAPSGRLGRLLAATGTTPQVGWAVDPAVVAAAAASPDPDTADWARDLVSASIGRTTYALPAYDPDLAAYARGGSALPTGTPLPGPGATDPSTDVATAAAAWRTDLAWPADAVPDVPTATLAAASGATGLVVGGDGLTPDDTLTYTPTGLAEVPTSDGDLTALVADPVISGLVAAGDDVTATQRLLAETAVVARERPAEQRHVLAALGRAWEPDPEALAARIDVLASAPWVELAPVADLASADVPDVPRADLPADAVDDSVLPVAQLRSLERSRDDLAAFATVATDPTTLTGPREPLFVTPTSVAFRSDPGARTAAVRAAATSTADVTDSIAVQPGSTITFIAESQDLPVRVSNDLPVDAVVKVRLRADGQQLQVSEQPVATVPAGSELTVPVQVRGFGSGNVTVRVDVVSAARPAEQVAPPAQFVVRVRSSWESVGTGVVVVLLVIALLAGIWRTVRRGRSPRRAPDAALPEPGQTTEPTSSSSSSPTREDDT